MAIPFGSRSEMSNVNPYLSKRSKSIVYNVNKTADGWDIEVLMPRRIPASDRIAILDWVHQYRQQVRAAHPFWSVVFHPSSNRYVLEIRKANNDKELIEIGEQLKSVCGEIMEYA
jgi:hypothetical protein